MTPHQYSKTAIAARPGVTLTGLSAVADLAQGVQGSVVAVGQGVKVALGGGDARVAESFLDDGQVGAAGEDPGGVGVAQVVKPRPASGVSR